MVVYPFVCNGYLSYFQFLVVTDEAAVSIPVQIFVCISHGYCMLYAHMPNTCSLGQILGMEWLNHIGLCLKQIIYFPK